MMEHAFVFDTEGRVIQYHTPQTVLRESERKGWSGGSIPDTRSLWDVLWERRQSLGGSGRKVGWEGPTGGVAHTHPWDGPTGPSQTDVTTFSAIEQGLGQRLLWPVVTFTHVTYCVWQGPGPYDYRSLGDWKLTGVRHAPFEGEALQNFAAGIERLRELSR